MRYDDLDPLSAFGRRRLIDKCGSRNKREELVRYGIHEIAGINQRVILRRTSSKKQRHKTRGRHKTHSPRFTINRRSNTRKRFHGIPHLDVSRVVSPDHLPGLAHIISERTLPHDYPSRTMLGAIAPPFHADLIPRTSKCYN